VEDLPPKGGSHDYRIFRLKAEAITTKSPPLKGGSYCYRREGQAVCGCDGNGTTFVS